MLFILSMTDLSGFGNIMNRWLKADIINVFIIVILPIGFNERFPIVLLFSLDVEVLFHSSH